MTLQTFPINVVLRLFACAVLLSPSLLAQAGVHAIVPEGATQSSHYSPAIDAGDYVYISGQGPRRPDGGLPTTSKDQVKQTLDKVQVIVKTAGLSMDHVVYIQIYMEDMTKCDEVKKAASEYFGKSQPAQALLGV